MSAPALRRATIEAFSCWLAESHGADENFDALLGRNPELALELRSLRVEWNKARELIEELEVTPTLAERL